MSKSDKTETNQKITLLKNVNKRLETIKKENIEKQLSHDWLTQLVEDQLKKNKHIIILVRTIKISKRKISLKMLQ